MNPVVSRLLIPTLLWLPVCFGLWYFTAEYHATALGAPVLGLVNATYPTPVTLDQKGAVLNFLLKVPAALSPRAGGGGYIMATITMDILIYSCGMPLFLALMLGSQGRAIQWKAVLLGLGIMWVYEFTAIYVSIVYNTLNFLHMIGADTRWLLGLPWSPYLNLLAQTTFALVLPSALAIFLWLGLNRHLLHLPSGVGSGNQLPADGP